MINGKVKRESWLRNLLTKQGVNLDDEETAVNLLSINKYFEFYLNGLQWFIKVMNLQKIILILLM